MSAKAKKWNGTEFQLEIIRDEQVPFQDRYIHALLVDEEGTPKVYVPLKPICQNLGISWHAQLERVNRDEVLIAGLRVARFPSGGGEQEMVCIDLDTLPLFLSGINPSRVRDELKPLLLVFKKKCKDVLADYFFGPRQNSLEKPGVSRMEQSLALLPQALVQAMTPLHNSMAEMTRQSQALTEELIALRKWERDVAQPTLLDHDREISQLKSWCQDLTQQLQSLERRPVIRRSSLNSHKNSPAFQEYLIPDVCLPDTDDTISYHKLELLKDLMKEKCGANRSLILRRWSLFKKHFGIKRIQDLPKARFDEALRYLNSL